MGNSGRSFKAKNCGVLEVHELRQVSQHWPEGLGMEGIVPLVGLLLASRHPASPGPRVLLPHPKSPRRKLPLDSLLRSQAKLKALALVSAVWTPPLPGPWRAPPSPLWPGQ